MKTSTEKRLNYLKTGAAVIIRRLQESDRCKIQGGFEALSQLSRYRRFLHNKNKLKQSEIDCLFTLPDSRGAAFIVLECIDTLSLAEGRCIGLIQLIKLDSQSTSAEVALVVIDEFHNCGVGKLLLDTIETQAVERKIQHLYFYTTSDNKPLSAILNRTGWDITVDRDFGSVTFITKVAPKCQPEALKNSYISNDLGNQALTNPIHQGRILTKSWFHVYLRMIIFLNQFNLYLYRGR